MLKILGLISLSLIILFSVYQYNLKPLLANREANLGYYDKALAKHTFLDHNIRFKIAQEIKDPESAIILIQENLKIRPYYVRNYLVLGRFYIQAQDIENANKIFEKAWQISLNRAQTLIEWQKADLASDNYKKAIEKLERAKSLNGPIGEIDWYLTLAKIGVGEIDSKTISPSSQEQKLELILVLQHLKKYEQIIEIYNSMLDTANPKNPANIQIYASLAVAYREIGDKDNAIKKIFKMLDIDESLKSEAEKFLRTLD